ncbi:MAG: hypothetical protein KJP07_05280 [Desulfatitalea sp.]|nr:hypothetical protein [Desulfatitalea sp.]
MKNIILGWTAVLLLAAGGSALAMDMDGVQIHGFIAQGFLVSSEYNFLSHKSTDGSFEYNEMGINFSKSLSDKLRIGMQLFARDLGDVSNNKITLDWAYGDYRFQDWLGLRAGKVKLPLGIYNEIRDFDLLRTSIVLPQGNLYSDMLRDTLLAVNGVSLYGNVPLRAAGNFDYQLIAGSLNADLDNGFEKYASSILSPATLSSEIHYKTTYMGKIQWNTPLSGLALSGSCFTTTNNFTVSNVVSIRGEVTRYRLSVEYTWQNLSLAYEHCWIRNEQTTFNSVSNVETKPLTNIEVYALFASYRFTDWFELGAYYTEDFPDSDDKDGNRFVTAGQPDHLAWQKDLALSFRFDLNDYCVFKIEGHKVNGAATVLAVDNPDRSESDWYYGATKITFSF